MKKNHHLMMQHSDRTTYYFLYYNLTMYSIAIQAGGKSQRMGMDKARMPFLGKSLLERVLERVSSLGDDILVTTNHPENFEIEGISLFEDFFPGGEALGGLLTGLSYAKNPTVLVVAVDMPFVNQDILIAARKTLLSTQVDVVIPQTKGGFEPFHAVYRRETCLPAVQNALEAGERRLISWFPSVNVLPMSEGELVQYDPLGIAFWNVNTPDELRKAEDFARELGE
jgi:molybdopterin-guanine dinucleotide biosynthesis protein A